MFRRICMLTMSRPLYCYLLLSLWITLMIAGMYKYIIAVENVNMPKQVIIRRESVHNNLKGDSKLQKIVNKFCNNPRKIQQESEGLKNEDAWNLQGVITIIRHGDRGPLTHIRDIDSVNCDAPYPTQLLQRYQEYITNATGLGKAPWAQSPGPFHNFPLLPSAPLTTCRIGQLTLVGVQQLLTIGTFLGKAYSSKFKWNVQFNNTVNTKDGMTVDSPNKIDVKSSNATNNKKSKMKITPNSTKKGLNTTLKTILPFDERTMHNKILEGEIVVHSTRYRRALQSALALIWSMLGGNNGVGGATAQESPSLAFCFTDCACPAADKYAKLVSRELKERLETHPAISDLVTKLSKIVSESPSQISNDPHILEDALLTYLCHAAPLPCMEQVVESAKQLNSDDSKPSKKVQNNSLKNQRFRRLLFNIPPKKIKLPKKGDEIHFNHIPKPIPLDFDSQMEKEKLGYYQQKLLENADSNYQDVVLVKRNMDGDFNFNGDNPQDVLDINYSDDEDEKKNEKTSNGKPPNIETFCVRKDQVTGLFAYTNWEMKQSAKSMNLKKVSLLRAYGMIRHIVQYILQMISEGKPKFVLYSGHDKTLQYLSLALGLTPENLHIQYASRIVIEVYKNNDKDFVGQNKKSGSARVAPLDFFFRLLINGQDITNQLSFCKKKVFKVEDFESDRRSSKSYLCKIENIIRFTHEDYFSIFNATNFKDACAVH